MRIDGKLFIGSGEDAIAPTQASVCHIKASLYGNEHYHVGTVSHRRHQDDARQTRRDVSYAKRQPYSFIDPEDVPY